MERIGREALVEHDADKLARREKRLVTALNAAVDYYAYGHELYESWKTQGAICQGHGGR